MLKLTLDREYKAAIYLRLSKEDGDFSFSRGKLESDSISSQRMLIQDYVKRHPEITIVREYCDDGYSGSNFERPAFQNMMDAVKGGEIDCIIVKDLSRFGREYIDSGNYLQKVFPTLGVRFIAINDNYDNAQPEAASDLVLPFKNLMNDSYCRDISIKVRTNLDIKRRSGQFVGSRVIYGYLRSPDKKQLIVDPQAAQVVQDIFRQKIEGMSPLQIANGLNEKGVLSPIEYKKANGSKQRTVFQTRDQALWGAVAIYRILQNEVYTGTLVQGKTTTPNHKVKKTILKDKQEWARTENAHEPIISSAQFDLVQRLMMEDSRRPTGAKAVHPFSGKIFCADCENTMIRKVAHSCGHEYVYFVCGGHKKDRHVCSSHIIQESLVFDTVLAVLQAHIAVALNMSAAMKQIDSLAWENREIKKITSQISLQEETIHKNQRRKTEAYEDFRTQLLSLEEYKMFIAEFDRKISKARDTIAKLNQDKHSIQDGLSRQQGWLLQFCKYENIQEITRNVVVSLIDRVIISENKEIEVRLLHGDIFQDIASFLHDYEKSDTSLLKKEVC